MIHCDSVIRRRKDFGAPLFGGGAYAVESCIMAPLGR